MIIKSKAYPRVGLIGNPSDGYNGKTISFVFTNFKAEVVLYETPELEILPSQKDHSVFKSIEALVNDVELHGYYGGIRLLKATVKRFYDYCSENSIQIHKRNFTIRYQSNIPHGVGLAGSSAIITACMRALMSFYGVDIPRATQANLVLGAETDELNITAGLQDRVVQVYESMVYMDFDKQIMEKQGCGDYEYLSPSEMPNFYVAYKDDFSQPTEIFHNNIKVRYQSGERKVVEAMKYWAELTDKYRKALEKGDIVMQNRLINANFDKRRTLYKLSQDHVNMIDAAREAGASSKFTGSGGAIVGIYQDEKMFEKLKKNFSKMKVKLIKPKMMAASAEKIK